MLLGGVFTVVGLVIHGGLLRRGEEEDFDVTGDGFGLVVRCEESEAAEVRRVITGAGMQEVPARAAGK
jgi:hypothetical protein